MKTTDDLIRETIANQREAKRKALVAQMHLVAKARVIEPEGREDYLDGWIGLRTQPPATRPAEATGQERLLLAIFGLKPGETFAEALASMRAAVGHCYTPGCLMPARRDLTMHTPESHTGLLGNWGFCADHAQPIH